MQKTYCRIISQKVLEFLYTAHLHSKSEVLTANNVLIYENDNIATPEKEMSKTFQKSLI